MSAGCRLAHRHLSLICMQPPEAPPEAKEWAQNTIIGVLFGIMYGGGKQYLADRALGVVCPTGCWCCLGGRCTV